MKTAAASPSLSFSFCCPVWKSCLTFFGLLAWWMLLGTVFLYSLDPHTLRNVQERDPGAYQLRDGGEWEGVRSFIHKCWLSTYCMLGEWEDVRAGRWQGWLILGFVNYGEDFVFFQRKWNNHSFFPPDIPKLFDFHNKNGLPFVYLFWDQPFFHQYWSHCSEHPGREVFAHFCHVSLGQIPGNGMARSYVRLLGQVARNRKSVPFQIPRSLFPDDVAQSGLPSLDFTSSPIR